MVTTLLVLQLVVILQHFITGMVDTVDIPPCFAAISGIYLRRYNDRSSYGLLFYFPLGGVLQLNSNEKQNSSNYFSDPTGFYKCTSQGSVRKLTYQGVYINELGNKTVSVAQSSSKCYGAIDDCSDRVVTCKNGNATTQEFVLEQPDNRTRKFTNALGSPVSKAFKSLRLYTHATVSSKTGSDKCYTELAGTYVVQYSDGSYGIVAFTPLGYLVSVTSNERNVDGTFNRGTSVGEFRLIFFKQFVEVVISYNTCTIQSLMENGIFHKSTAMETAFSRSNLDNFSLAFT